jgi:hypothetical protein
MKLYDVIRKEHKDKGIPDPEPMPVYVAPRVRTYDDHPRSSWRKVAVIAGALLFIVLLYIGGTYFVHAKITITERHIPFSLQNTQLEVMNEKNADAGRLSFQTMIVTDKVTRQIFGSSLTTSTTKATGKIVIFNQYSAKAQTVKSGTTVTGANGQKYITQNTVVVPGYTGAGTAKAAGSASVGVVAAGIGPAYNSTGTTFTIAGWSGATAKTFFASSGPITGGNNGAMHTLTDADKKQAIQTLQAALQEKLARQTRSQIPDDLVTFPDLQFTSIDTSSLVLEGDAIQFPATLEGTMVSYLIPRDLLERAIASKAISDHAYPHVTIPDLGSVKIASVSALPTNPANVPESITIAVSGQGTIITKVPVSTVQQAVLSIKRKAFTSALSGIPEIDTAEYSLYPFWAPYFPYKSDRITIKVQ